MREALDSWAFVIAAYVTGVGGTAAMIAWSWLAMRRAERRREKARGE
jgi:nitrate reductase gamma subunit